MKILHLIYTTGIAGAEKYLVNLLPGLKEYNIDCDLICVCPKSAIPIITTYCEMMKSKGIKVTLLIGGKKNFLFIVKSINNYLKQEGINIIHAHLSSADLLAVLIKTMYNKKLFIISSKHGYDEKYLVKYSADAKRHKIDRNLYYYFTKLLLNKINVNLAISKAISDLYFNIKLTPKPYPYIHHGIPETEIDNDIAQLNQIIIIGRLENMKGHKFLLEAMPEVIKHFPSIRLLILGEGSEKYNLQKQATDLGIEKEIIFMGFQTDPYTYIRQSKIIILPSLFEPFGLVYIEAFSLKVPVVAFDVPAANEIIINNETGILIQRFDSQMLSQKIIYLLSNNEKRKELSEKAYQKFLEYYTEKRMVKETATWYISLGIYK